MALVIELDETRDGVTMSRTNKGSCVLRTFGVRGNKLLLGLEFGQPKTADLDLELDTDQVLTLFGLPVGIAATMRSAGKVALELTADRSINFARINAKKKAA